MYSTIRQARALKKEKDELQGRLACLRANYEHLAEENDKTRSERDDLWRKNEALEQKLKCFNTLYEKLDSRHKALEVAYDELDIELERTANKAGTESLSYKLLNAAYKEACAKVKDLTVRNKAQCENIKHYQEDAKEFKRQIAALKEQIEKRENTICNLHSINYDLNAELNDLNTELNNLNTEVNNLKIALEKGHQEATDMINFKLANKSQECRDLQKENGDLYQQIAGLEDDNKICMGENNSLREQIEEMKRLLKSQKTISNVIMDEKEDTRQQVHDLQAMINKMKASHQKEIAKLKHSYSVAMKLLEEEEAKTERLDGENRDLKIENGDLKIENGDLKIENGDLKERITEVTQKKGPHKCGECANGSFFGGCVIGTCFGFVDKNKPETGSLKETKSVNMHDGQYCPRFLKK